MFFNILTCVGEKIKKKITAVVARVNYVTARFGAERNKSVREECFRPTLVRSATNPAREGRLRPSLVRSATNRAREECFRPTLVRSATNRRGRSVFGRLWCGAQQIGAGGGVYGQLWCGAQQFGAGGMFLRLWCGAQQIGAGGVFSAQFRGGNKKMTAQAFRLIPSSRHNGIEADTETDRQTYSFTWSSISSCRNLALPR